MDFSTVNILGFPVARLSMAQVIAKIAAKIESQEGKEDEIKSKSTLHIVTANAEILYRAYEAPALGQLLLKADIITPDGKGTVQAAQKLGQPVPERVTGIDLMWQLLPMAEQAGWRIYLLGASEEVILQTVKIVQEKWPAIKIAGWHNGYFNDEARPAIIENIIQSQVDIIFVALGFPAQDRFIVEMGREAKVKKPAVSIGVGGSFDAISGNVKRAPLWIQELGLEWAYRFAQNPKRLGRATALPKFVMAVHQQSKEK